MAPVFDQGEFIGTWEGTACVGDGGVHCAARQVSDGNLEEACRASRAGMFSMILCVMKKNPCWCGRGFKPGSDLLSHAVTHAVPSA